MLHNATIVLNGCKPKTCNNTAAILLCIPFVVLIQFHVYVILYPYTYISTYISEVKSLIKRPSKINITAVNEAQFSWINSR